MRNRRNTGKRNNGGIKTMANTTWEKNNTVQDYTTVADYILEKKEIKPFNHPITKVEKLLVSGTFGICTGVWVTLAYLIYVNGF